MPAARWGILPAVQGAQPTVFWTPLGKNTIRMVQTAPLDLPKGR